MFSSTRARSCSSTRSTRPRSSLVSIGPRSGFRAARPLRRGGADARIKLRARPDSAPDPDAPLTDPSPSPSRPGLVPGVLLCAALALAAWALQLAEVAVFRHAVVEALVIAMLLGVAVRTAWTPTPRFEPGIKLTARQVLEVAVVLLGASVD